MDQLPDVLRNRPVASINYRWDIQDPDEPKHDAFAMMTQWPAPVHDTAFAYSWLVDNLKLPEPRRRDIYVYGSYVGASLATSLALTEAHKHAPFGVRGVAAYNGIYNWTMFLPEHPVHKVKKWKRGLQTLNTQPLAKGDRLEGILDDVPSLFGKPAHLFDTFASPSLFFHNPGLHVPTGFNAVASPLDEMMGLLNLERSGADAPTTTVRLMKPPRKSHLVFPPRTSTLTIPETLLLHDRHPDIVSATGKRKLKPRGHTFQMQADELAELMRRSIDKVELKERSKWDDEMDTWAHEAQRRVQVADVGEEEKDLGLGLIGQEMLSDWLDDRAT